MASNPLDDNDPAMRERIERRAYHLWEDDGRPHGQHDEYWERARELVGMELAGNTGQKPNPATLPGADPNAPDIIEDASIQENLGEFPDRFADQGEKTATPKARSARPRKAPVGAPVAAPIEKPAEKPAKATKPAKAPAPAPAPAAPAIATSKAVKAPKVAKAEPPAKAAAPAKAEAPKPAKKPAGKKS